MDKEAALKEDFKGQLCLKILNCVREEETEPRRSVKDLVTTCRAGNQSAALLVCTKSVV